MEFGFFGEVRFHSWQLLFLIFRYWSESLAIKRFYLCFTRRYKSIRVCRGHGKYSGRYVRKVACTLFFDFLTEFLRLEVRWILVF